MLKNIPLIGYLYNWLQCRNRQGTMSEIFTDYYKENYWASDESVSGGGSELNNVQKVINELPVILKSVSAKTMLDIPCGDYNWMRAVDLGDVRYIGGDIVEDVIKRNKKNVHDENVEFKTMNLCETPLPMVDVVFVRDCLVHLSNEDIKIAINNIIASGSRYLLTTTFPKKKVNKDIKTGFWRTINMQKEPFNFDEPEMVLNEGFSSKFGRYADKSLGLWKISKISRYNSL